MDINRCKFHFKVAPACYVPGARTFCGLPVLRGGFGGPLVFHFRTFNRLDGVDLLFQFLKPYNRRPFFVFIVGPDIVMNPYKFARQFEL